MPREFTPRPATSIDRVAAAMASVLPRAFTPAIDRLRLDVGTVLADLRGERPMPYIDADHPARPPMPLASIRPFARHAPALDTAVVAASPTPARRPDLFAARTLHVEAVIRETDDAVSLVLVDRSGASIEAVAGQFFTLLVDLDGETHRRAYSLSSDVRDTTRARITIKRVRDGRVSNHLNDSVREGDALRVLGPSGAFTVVPDATRATHHVLIAGGSGITPMMAIAQSVLHGEPDSRVTVLFGNRHARDVIFAAELKTLANRHGPRFTLRHVHEIVDDEAHAHGRGRLDRATVAAELTALGIDPAQCDFYVCGPAAMMDETRAALSALGVASERVREERFFDAAARGANPVVEDRRAQRITFRVAKSAPREVIAAPGQTLLEAGLGAGIDMPFSCTMGGCGACRVKRVDGEVQMEEPNCLTDDERAEGYVLACVGRAGSPCVVDVPT